MIRPTNSPFTSFLNQKGTLLNRLFGTSFVEMDENQRQQTTKGIWLSRGRGMHVLVMDVEGTDGRERGEDQDFERKSALFSMATSEVIIINLWEHQVGLYQGANMGLLKTVFEVNLQLFQNQKRYDISFVTNTCACHCINHTIFLFYGLVRKRLCFWLSFETLLVLHHWKIWQKHWKRI